MRTRGPGLLGWLCVALPLVAWLPPAIAASLWLDEAGTVWMIGDGLGDAFDRSLRYQGQSPAYALIAWAASRAGDGLEIALRAPSLLGMAVAAWLVVRLGTRLFDREAGLLAGVAFVASGPVAYAAGDARGYAIAVAAVTASALAVVRWCEDRRSRDLVVGALAAAASVYVHYLAGLALVGPLLYAGRRLGPRAAARFASLTAALLVPAVPNLLAVFARRDSLSVNFPFPIGDVLTVIAPPAAVAAVVAVALRARASWSPVPAGDAQPWLLVPWVALPPATLWLLTLLTPVDLTFSRYYLSAAPAAALVAGWALRGLQTVRARRLAAAALVILSLPVLLGPTIRAHSNEGWREAAALASALGGGDATVFVGSGFIEASDVTWLDEPERRAYLLAPVAAYPVEGRALPLPYDIRDEATAWLARELERAGPNVLLIARAPSPVRAWVDAYLAARGYRGRLAGSFGVLRVNEYRRPAGA